MSRPIKLVLLAVLSLAILAFLCSSAPLSPPSDRADAALAVKTPRPQPETKTAPATPRVAAPGEPKTVQTFLGERLLEPREWHPPTLRMVLNTARPSRPGAPLASAIPRRTRLDLESPTGNYAALRPQQLGEAHQADARLQGTMFTVLRHGYSLAHQHEQNVALVPISFDVERANFALHAESAGHYLITLHLSNPSSTSYVFRNRLVRLQFEHHVVPVLTMLVEQDETVQGGASFVVPCLLQLDADEWANLIWHLQGGTALFHALTVDKLG